MVCLIGDSAATLSAFLKERGIVCRTQAASDVPSLTALLLGCEEMESCVIDGGCMEAWSLGHILAAAKLLQTRGGKMIVYGQCKHKSALLSIAQSQEELLLLLAKRAGGSASGGAEKPQQVQQSARAAAIPTAPAVEPLSIPAGKMLILGVVGAQPRIGCTTHAVGLYHYCKALGFTPAVVSAPEKIAQLAAPMQNVREIAGGCLVENVPFVADTAQSYDCYILDLGAQCPRSALDTADCLVLVAGVKPWEVPNTAAALRMGKLAAVILSFCAAEDGKALLPLLRGLSVAAAPWMPQLWKPSRAALAIYDTLLRQGVERELQRTDELPEAAEENFEIERMMKDAF